MSLLRAGVSTFAADPARDCVRSDYMWTAAADPHVLLARVLSYREQDTTIDLSQVPYSAWNHGARRHVRIDLPDGTIRLDLDDSDIAAKALRIEPAVDLLRPLEPQFASILRLHALCRGETSPVHDQRFVRLVEALRVSDALADGASLREIALGILGDDWPGDSEYLKSRARRRVALAAALVRAGPSGILAAQL